MFGFPLMDVMIGLVFVYALLALICSAANEIYAGFVDRRENHLHAGVANLLGEHPLKGTAHVKVAFTPPGSNQPPAHSGLVQAFYAHPLIKSLNEKGTRPSYIPDSVFARVILDLFAPTDGLIAPVSKFENFVNGVKSSLPPDSDLRRTLLIQAEDAGGDLGRLNSNLMSWFNETMKRVSGWYKKQSQASLLLISFLVCLAINADSISIIKELYSNPAKRTVVVAQAEQANKLFAAYTSQTLAGSTATAAASAKTLQTSLANLEATGLSFGWQGYTLDTKNSALSQLLSKLIGILFTALAATLGAPFWFDMLAKLINMRAIGKPPTETAPKHAVTGEAVSGGSQLAATLNPAAMNMDEKSVG